MRLQRFVRRRILRVRWHQLVIDLVGYNELIKSVKQARDEIRVASSPKDAGLDDPVQSGLLSASDSPSSDEDGEGERG